MLNEAVNQGMLVPTAGGSDFTSVNGEAGPELRVSATIVSTPPPRLPASPGPNETTDVALDLAQLQDCVEEGSPTLTKILGRVAPEFLVKIRLKGKQPASLAEANVAVSRVAYRHQVGAPSGLNEHLGRWQCNRD